MKVSNSTKRDRMIKFLLLTVLCLIIACVGFIVGYFVRKSVEEDDEIIGIFAPSTAKQTLESIITEIMDEIKVENLNSTQRLFASKIHVAGSARNLELADEIYKRFKSYNFTTELFDYNVLLSYPQQSRPNLAHLIDENEQSQFASQVYEGIVEASEATADRIQPFNAYSPIGEVKADLVYGHYGRYEDFQALKQVHNVDCSGKIVILRLGKGFRGEKVRNAHENGAVGVLLYTDPEDYGPVPDDSLFPNSRWLPRDGIQSGTIAYLGFDPQTPSYPSKDYAYRLTTAQLNNENSLPPIPCHPISSKDAFHFISRLAGPVAPSTWKGQLKTTYNLGPGFKAPYNQWKVELNVYNERKSVPIRNVIGTIRGSIEPDRYVLIGNHRDAWAFGSLDPVSGTAVMMEIARAISVKMGKGWRPRRTIKFCSWDAEEQGMIGSGEWVEEFRKQLSERAVAYINSDTTVFGNASIVAAASPLLHELTLSAMKKVRDPYDETLSVYDRSAQILPSATDKTKPMILTMQGVSDFVPFHEQIGVPCFESYYIYEDKEYNTTFYPTYHTLHDTTFMVEHFVDPDYRLHQTNAKLMAAVMVTLADDALIAFNVPTYPQVISSGLQMIEAMMSSMNASQAGISSAHLRSALTNLTTTAEKFKERLENLDKTNPHHLRMFNDQLLQFERYFINPTGLPNRPFSKHIVFSPVTREPAFYKIFPGITDQLQALAKGGNWNDVDRQLTIATALVQAAAQSLNSIV